MDSCAYSSSGNLDGTTIISIGAASFSLLGEAADVGKAPVYRPGSRGGRAMSAPIMCRDDLSFTQRDEWGRMINWPRNNPGVASNWPKGASFLESEIAELAAFNETEAFHAIEFTIIGMAARATCLEIGFAEAVARVAVLGLRAMRNGAEHFEPVRDEG